MRRNEDVFDETNIKNSVLKRNDRQQLSVSSVNGRKMRSFGAINVFLSKIAHALSVGHRGGLSTETSHGYQQHAKSMRNTQTTLLSAHGDLCVHVY